MASPGLTKHEKNSGAVGGPSPEGAQALCERFSFAMNLLSRRWMGQILRILLTGPHRFNELLDAIDGLSDPLLTQRLRELVDNKLATRSVSVGSPVRVEYGLTESGYDLEAVIDAIAAWAEKWHGKPA